MDNPISGPDAMNQSLASRGRPAKPKMLVVDDEPDNLDLLYRTFRRDFQVLKAESGIRALELLETEGEVAVIISDQRMPEMKGTEFLSKTVPQFPNTVRIILTGFTDVEDLVEAINSGQVYKYITKPWDPNELKAVVQRAAETYELVNQRTEELLRAQAQNTVLRAVAQIAQEAQTIADCLQSLAAAFGQAFSAHLVVVQLVENGTPVGAQGLYGATGSEPNWLAQDPLVQAAIAQQTPEVANPVAADERLSGVGHYATSGTQAHLVVPIQYRQETTAVLSMQWQETTEIEEDDLNLIYLCAQQAGLVLTCTRYSIMTQP